MKTTLTPEEFAQIVANAPTPFDDEPIVPAQKNDLYNPMSIEERLIEIQNALNQARMWLDCTEALVKQFVMVEKPSLEMLVKVATALGKEQKN